MQFSEYNSNELIDFYIKNGLEFDENKGYFGTEIKSFVLINKDKIIGAVSISNYKDKNFIEALAIETDYRNKGIGKRLLEKAIKELGIPVYTISKVDNFYLKNGWTYDNTDLISEEYKKFKEYNVNCFPRVMKYEVI